MSFCVGGNPPLPSSISKPCITPAKERTIWLASGRDAYLYISRLLERSDWYLPDFLCKVVPETLKRAGYTCIPYRPGHLSDALRPGPRQRVAVTSWDVDGIPPREDWEYPMPEDIVRVEDRCLWAGMPQHVTERPDNVFVIGSIRKWVGLAEGGWIQSGDARLTKMGSATSLSGDEPSGLALHRVAQLAASALRRLRALTGNDCLEQANLVCSDLAEDSLGIPEKPRAISRLGMALIESVAGDDSERNLRLEMAKQIQLLAGSSRDLTCGVIGLRCYCTQRDALQKDLAQVNIFAPVHWRDGDWSGSGGIAEDIAGNTITLPCPPLPDQASRDDYLGRLEYALKAYDYRIVSLNHSN